MQKRITSMTAIKDIYSDIRAILETARTQLYRTVNFIMVEAYWNIGRVITKEELKGARRAGYGEALINELSKRLSKEFGKGFDPSNLWYMRQFYITFPILDALRRELTWTHYRYLLKIEKSNAREFYMNETVENKWSTRQLERQINSFYFERLLASKNKQPVRNELDKKVERFQPADVIKDPYVLEFLNLKENIQYLEHDIEQALIDKLEDFLLELGKGFSFVARQKRISEENDHFYIDLVFYNYLLKCFVLIDLKVGKLTHQDIGQMEFYVNWYEANQRLENDNPTIGIILCSDKNDAVVKYSIKNNHNNLFASRYKLYLPSEKELQTELKRERAIVESQAHRMGLSTKSLIIKNDKKQYRHRRKVKKV